MLMSQEWEKIQLLLYVMKAKAEKTFDEKKTIKKVNIKKRAHVFKNYVHSYTVEILNSFYP